MNLQEFIDRLQKCVPVGAVLNNPSSGTSEVYAHTDKICYLRGSSSISVSYSDLFDAYQQFNGGNVSTSELKQYNPSVFDSNARPSGHSCNCTFLFLILKEMRVVNEIQGNGVKGDPYYVDIHN